MFLKAILMIQYVIMEFQSTILEFKLNSQLHFEVGCYCSINLYFHLSTPNPQTKPNFKIWFPPSRYWTPSLGFIQIQFLKIIGRQLFSSLWITHTTRRLNHFFLVWLTWWVLHLIISGLYSIPLSLFIE
jgi:hypothetical protein